MSKIISHPAAVRAMKSPYAKFLFFFAIALLAIGALFFDGYSEEKTAGPAGLLLLVALFAISVGLHFLTKKFPSDN